MHVSIALLRFYYLSPMIFLWQSLTEASGPLMIIVGTQYM